MYSSRAVVTASLLVLCSPRRRASSIRLSSIARLVAMCRLLHMSMCGTMPHSWLQKNPGTVFGVHPKTETEKMVTVLERRTHVTRRAEAGRVFDGVEVGGGAAGVGRGKRKRDSTGVGDSP